jgi:crossover junction endodeoxyribonuclease RuvC
MYSASWWKKFYLKSPEKNNPSLKILGIDPGSIKCGYGLVGVQGKDPFYINSGTISTPSSKPLHERLKYIYQSLLEIIHESRPDDVVVEKIFFAKGAKAALNLGHARGIVLLAAASEGISIHECSALEVKKSVVGYGRAEKHQVSEMVRMILNVREPLYPDSADALALALCYANTIKFTEAVKRDRN